MSFCSYLGSTEFEIWWHNILELHCLLSSIQTKDLHALARYENLHFIWFPQINPIDGLLFVIVEIKLLCFLLKVADLTNAFKGLIHRVNDVYIISIVVL